MKHKAACQLLTAIDDGNEAAARLLDPNYAVQQKFDGKRIILHIERSSVTAHNREGLTCSVSPNIIAEARQFEAIAPIMFDGEWIRETKTLHAFDILEINGTDIRPWKFIDRNTQLLATLQAAQTSSIQTVRTECEQAGKIELLQEIHASNLEGIVLKKINSPYRTDRQPDQFKHKFTVVSSFVITKKNEKDSVALGLFNDKGRMTFSDAARQAAMAESAGPPFEPVALNRPNVAARSALKVAVLNVAGGAHLDAIVGCLRRPPLADAGTLLLCEASWRMPRHGLVEFAPALAAALKMSFAFLPSFGRDEGGGDFRAIGNALLCAQPLDDFRVVRLPKSPFKFRARHLPGVNQGLLASINVDGRRVRIGVAHLERVWDPEGRALQMECFLSEIGSEAPVIVGGDFNTTTMDMDRRWAMLRAAAALALRPRRFHEPQAHEPLFDRIKRARIFDRRGERSEPRRRLPSAGWCRRDGVRSSIGSRRVEYNR